MFINLTIIVFIAFICCNDIGSALKCSGRYPSGLSSRLSFPCAIDTTNNGIFQRTSVATASTVVQRTSYTSKGMAMNADGVVDVSELMHVPLVTSHFNGMSRTMGTFKFADVFGQIKGLFNVEKRVMAFILIFCVSHNFILNVPVTVRQWTKTVAC